MQHFPTTIHVGMDVYDRTHAHIGTVDDLKFPENITAPAVDPALADRQNGREELGLVDALRRSFGTDPIPDVLRERLEIDGYVRLDADGLFAADRFITPDQIALVAGDELILNVNKHELIKAH